MSTERERDDAQLAELLRSIDHSPPPVTAHDIVRRARSGSRPWLRMAAGIMLALVLGGVAYALPGSPLRSWVDAFRAPGAPAPPAPAPGAGETEPPAGLSLDPREPLTVEISGAHPGARLAVSLGADESIVLLAAAGTARFASYPQRVHVEPLAVGTLELRVPRGATRVEVTVNGRRTFLLEDGTITTSAPGDGRGGYLLRLDPP